MIIYLLNACKTSWTSYGVVSQNIRRHLVDDVELMTIQYQNDWMERAYPRIWILRILFSYVYDLCIAFKILLSMKKYRCNGIIFCGTVLRLSSIFSILPIRIRKYDIFHDDFYLYESGILSGIKYKIKIRALFGYDKLFATSRTTYDMLLSLGIPEHRIVLAPLGIDHQMFNTIKEKPNPVNKRFILIVGSGEKRKNMRYAVKAFALLKRKYPDLVLVGVGYMSADFYRQMLCYIKKNQLILNKDVLLCGYVDLSQLKHYYIYSELLLFPSLEEGFGLPIVEAQACGTPVVTSNRPPMKDLVPYPEVLVDPEDEASIVAACERILTDRAWRKQLIASGLDNARQYDWRKTAKIIARHVM